MNNQLNKFGGLKKNLDLSLKVIAKYKWAVPHIHKKGTCLVHFGGL